MRALTALFVSLFTLAATPAAFAQDAPLRSIAISAQGEVTAPPDMATVRLGVQEEGRTEAIALDAASSRTASVLTALAALDVAEKDIRTTGLRLVPRYAQTSQGRVDYTRIDGFTATNEISVKLRDINAVSGVLAAVVGAGANMVQSISFGLQDQDELRDEARRRAVAEAIRLAGLYADAAGVGLGPVLTISDQSGGGPVYDSPMAMTLSREAMPAPPPVAPGEIAVSANISIVFQIID